MAIELGTKLEGKVTGITHFGAFIEISEGVTGLVHISEIADNYVKDVNDHIKLDDKVNVKVINVDKDGKIGLSIKQAVDRPADEKPKYTEQRKPYTKPNSFSNANGDRPQQSYGGGGDRNQSRGGGGNRNAKPAPGKLTFEDKVTRFLKDSEERISSLKKNTESKRGGRGGRRD